MLPPTITNTLPFCYYCLVNQIDDTLYVCLCGLTTCSLCLKTHTKHMKLFPQNHEDLSFFDNFYTKDLTQKELKEKWLEKHKGLIVHNVIGEINKNEIQFFNITEEEEFIVNKKLFSLWNNASDCLHVSHNHVKLNLNDKLKIEGLIKLKGKNLPEKEISIEGMHKFIEEIKKISKNNYACFSCISETTSQTKELNKIPNTPQTPHNLYLCLSCFSVNCGRNNYVMFGKEHMKVHYEETGHEVVIQVINGLCFCYKCNQIISIPLVSEYLGSLGIYTYNTNNNNTSTNSISNNTSTNTISNNKESKENILIPNYKEIEKEHSKISFDLKQHYEGITEIPKFLNKEIPSKKPKELIDFTPLPNYKNTCYVSTTFQLLSRIFRKKYDLESHLTECTNDTYFDCLGCWILKILRYLNTFKGNLLIDDFLNNLYVRTPQFQVNRHEDASEFLNYLFCVIESFEGKESFPFLMDSLKIRILKVSICETRLKAYSLSPDSTLNTDIDNSKDINKDLCSERPTISTDFSYSQIIGFTKSINSALKNSIEPLLVDCPCGHKKIFKEFLFPSEELLIDLKRYDYDYTNNTIEKIDSLIKPDILEFNSKIDLKDKIYTFNLKNFIEDFLKQNSKETVQNIKKIEEVLEGLKKREFEGREFESRGTVLHLGTADSGHYMLMLKKGVILSDDRIFKCPESLIENGYIFWYSEK